MPGSDPLQSDKPRFFELTQHQLAAIGNRHGIDSHVATRLPSNGLVHAVYALSDRVVLRVPRNIPEGISDTRTEAVAVPVAQTAGIMTPALIAFDDSCEILPVPYTLMERVHAVPLSVDELDSDSDVLAELGRQLAILHGKVTSCPDPNGWLDPIDTLDGSLIVRDIDEAAGVDQSRRTAASELVARLSDLIAAHDEARVFSHGDVHVRNVLGAPQRLAALIDWGDAGWGHPAFDFAHLPMRLIPAVLGGYEREAPASFPCLRQAITLAHLVTAARHMGRPRTPRYRETGLQELDDVLAFVGDAGPEWA